MRSLIISLKPVMAFLGLIILATNAHARTGVFQGLGGSWSGNGTITLSDGNSERLRCRANYQVDGSGNSLQQTLRCASDSYRFDLNSNVSGSDGNISGTWSETSRNINGSLQGRGSNGRITLAIDAPGFSAGLSLTTRGNRQSVSITSQGDIRSVSISLVRS